MKPWCAEGDVPTAANLNLYRGWKSCVGWRSDDEPLFGKCGDAKLIVSVSFGSSALFKWKRQSCSHNEAHLCWLGYGGILVMDGQCQDEFLHRTDPGREQDRINISFRWVKQHASSCPLFQAGVACCLPTCAQGSSVPVMVNAVCDVFGLFGLLFGALCILGVLALLVISLVCTRERCCATHKTAKYLYETGGSFTDGKLYMLASAGQPSLHGYDACMVYWIKEAPRRICRQKYGKTSFFSFSGFSV